MNVLDIIKMNIKSYRCVTCCMKPDDNILFFNYHENLDVDLTLAEELVSNRLEFTKNKKHYLIQRISNTIDIDYAAAQHLKDIDKGLKNILGLACIISHPLAIKIVDIFTNKNKKFPSKIFNTEEAAITWINELKEYHRVTQQ